MGENRGKIVGNRAPGGPQGPPGPWEPFLDNFGTKKKNQNFGPKSEPWILPTVGRNPPGTLLILFQGPGYIDKVEGEPTIFHLTPGG